MPMKPLLLAFSIAAALAATLPAPASAAPATPAAASKPAPAPAWVAKSNAYAQILIDAQGRFSPEQFSFLGIPGYDDQVADLGPDNGKRFRDALTQAKAALDAKAAHETDPNV